MDSTKTRIIDGTALAARIRGEVAEGVARLAKEKAIVPGLAVVLAGDDAASQVYVRSKEKKAAEVGMVSSVHRLPGDVSPEEASALVDRLNADPAVHGILLQLPLPGHLSTDAMIDSIALAKDVDGFHVANVGLLGTGRAAMVPCTPLGCLKMLNEVHGDLSGMEAVVIGRSAIVGRPMAQLLLRENCTVTIAHSRTRNLPETVRRADIVVCAAGRPEMISGDWIKAGASVIDVGINRVERDGKARLVGDCHFESCARVAGAITPVPGGVGPMTIACLLANTLTACRHSSGLESVS